MRSGQQNKRGRGRNNNQRKSGNPLSRTYDSTGPDVKIRGTAQHIADKYAAMARDALGAGDTVMAENYLQHAEHYNRIIAAAQAQIQERYQRDDRDNAEREQAQPESANTPAESGERETVEAAVDGSGPQPVISGTPAEVAIGEESMQPSRRTSTRRRATTRPRRPRNAENGAGGEEINGSGGATEGSATAASSEAPETTPEVAAVARDA